MININHKPSAHHAKRIYLIVGFVLFILWVLSPYMHNETDLLPHNYYRFGVVCLNHFEVVTHNDGYKLMNTYAKRILKGKDMVFIRAKNQDNEEQLQIACIYDDTSLEYLGLDGEKIYFEKKVHIN